MIFDDETTSGEGAEENNEEGGEGEGAAATE